MFDPLMKNHGSFKIKCLQRLSLVPDEKATLANHEMYDFFQRVDGYVYHTVLTCGNPCSTIIITITKTI
ncbi:hypothetical protein FKM82_005709 [Ascaphus truei]